jgi:CMP-N,N'-diacetyllegionaminic acid synthase
MLDGSRVIAVIPARAGSKGVPGKNLKSLGGKPLIAWPIDTAHDVPEIDRVIVSTDGPEIATEAKKLGAEAYDRPADLATDGAVVIDALRDLVARLRAEGETAKFMVLLEATSPLRAVSDVRDCLALLADQNLDSVATFKDADLPPAKAWRLNGHVPTPYLENANPWLPRQKTEAAMQLSGAVYAFDMDKLPDTGNALLFGMSGAVMMPRSRCVDIDDEMDFTIAEAMILKGHDDKHAS